MCLLLFSVVSLMLMSLISLKSILLLNCKEMWNTYTMEYYSVIKNEIIRFAVTQMDLEIIILSEIKQRLILYDIVYCRI